MSNNGEISAEHIYFVQISMMTGAAILTGASFIMALAPNWQTLVFARAADGIAIIGNYHANTLDVRDD